MNKAELVEAMSDECNVTKKDIERILNSFLGITKQELAKGGKVQLIGFGTFEVSERSERQCKHPQTGELMTVPACKVPKFKAGKAFKEMVN